MAKREPERRSRAENPPAARAALGASAEPADEQPALAPCAETADEQPALAASAEEPADKQPALASSAQAQPVQAQPVQAPPAQAQPAQAQPARAHAAGWFTNEAIQAKYGDPSSVVKAIEDSAERPVRFCPITGAKQYLVKF